MNCLTKRHIQRSPPLLYVAGAYKGNVSANIAKAEEVSISLIRNGWNVFTPHKNTAGYEKYEGEELSESTWITMDLGMLARCDALYVMNNWQTSCGTQSEIVFALEHDIPIFWEDIVSASEFVNCPATSSWAYKWLRENDGEYDDGEM